MKKLTAYVTESNSVTFLIILFILVGAIKVIGGTLELSALVKLLSPEVAALAAGAGLATIKFVKAPAGTPVLGFVVVLVLVYAIIGAIQVVAPGDKLTFEAYLKLMQVPVAGLAIGKGLFANNRAG